MPSEYCRIIGEVIHLTFPRREKINNLFHFHLTGSVDCNKLETLFHRLLKTSGKRCVLKYRALLSRT